MLEHFLNQGYTDADPNFQPHISDKHGFYKLEKDGRFYFAKYSKTNTARQNSIATDIWWCKTIQNLREAHGVLLQSPKIVDYGEDWYITQWINGQPSVKPTDNATRLDPYLDRYASILADLDRIELEWIKTDPPNSDNSTPYDRLDARWEEWSQKPLSEGLLTAVQLQEAYSLVQNYQKYVTPQLQHGDFVPWHMLADDNQALWLIDGEHASTQKPRYYDLAYMYSRIFTRLRSPKHAAKLLEIFIQKSEMPAGKIYSALLPVMTSRAIGMLFDALSDLPHDYRADAQDLLARCLSRDPARLTS